MRALLTLACLLLANGHDQAECALDGLGAVDEALDAAIYVWASTKRCVQPHAITRCEVDVTSAIESVNGMINVILKAVDKCGGLKTKHASCGMAVGVLTESAAGLAAASGGIMSECVWADHSGVRSGLREAAEFGDNRFGRLGRCAVDVKHSLKAIFKTIKILMTVKNEHKSTKKGARNALKIVAAFAGLGEYLAGIVGHCTHVSEGKALCAAQSARLVKQLTNIGNGGQGLAKHCHLSPSRLYELENEDDETEMPESASGNSVTIALAAMLPLAAVFGFVGGSRLSKVRSQRSTHDSESLMPVDTVEE